MKRKQNRKKEKKKREGKEITQHCLHLPWQTEGALTWEVSFPSGNEIGVVPIIEHPTAKDKKTVRPGN